MNDNKKVKAFLAQLRRFLPEKTIYLALSSLPEDVFDNEEYTRIPDLETDEEIQALINDKGFEDPDNLANFFMEPYMENLENMLNEVLGDMESAADCETRSENIYFNMKYNQVCAK